MAESCDETGVIPSDDLIAAANKAKEIETDRQRVVKHPLPDLIQLDEHLAKRRASCAASGNGWGMVAKSRVVPPSAVGEERE